MGQQANKRHGVVAMTESYKAHILLVEDDICMTEMICEIIGDEYVVTTASNGKEALMVMKGIVPDLVITDVNMPEMNGLLLLKRMRQNLRLVHVPVIVNSSNGDIYIHKLSTAVQTWIMAEKSKEEELKSLIHSALRNRISWK
ncbi:MAG: response regulator [Deltaproteobacteria bacterium]|nr:response regulator [Deltaproteobacteria bacterium]